jgi:hypothetical protein
MRKFRNTPRKIMLARRRRRVRCKYLVEFFDKELNCILFAFGSKLTEIRNSEEFIRLKFTKPWSGGISYDDDQRRYVVAKCHKRQQRHKKFRFGWEWDHYHNTWKED